MPPDPNAWAKRVGGRVQNPFEQPADAAAGTPAVAAGTPATAARKMTLLQMGSLTGDVTGCQRGSVKLGRPLTNWKPGALWRRRHERTGRIISTAHWATRDALGALTAAWGRAGRTLLATSWDAYFNSVSRLVSTRRS